MTLIRRANQGHCSSLGSAGSLVGNLPHDLFIEQFLQVGKGNHAVIQAVQEQQQEHAQPHSHQAGDRHTLPRLRLVPERPCGRLHDRDALRSDFLVHIQGLHRRQQTVVERLDSLSIPLEPLVFCCFALDFQHLAIPFLDVLLEILDLQSQRHLLALQLLNPLQAEDFQQLFPPGDLFAHRNHLRVIRPEVTPKLLLFGLQQQQLLFRLVVIDVRSLAAGRRGVFRDARRRDQCPSRVLLAVQALIHGQHLKHIIFGFLGGQALVKRRQVIARAVALVLGQNQAVGALKGNQLGIGTAQVLLQPHYLFRQARHRGVGSLGSHLLFQDAVFLHAGLQKRLRVCRVAAGGLQHEDRRPWQNRHLQYHWLHPQFRFLGGDARVRPVDDHAALH